MVPRERFHVTEVNRCGLIKNRLRLCKARGGEPRFGRGRPMSIRNGERAVRCAEGQVGREVDGGPAETGKTPDCGVNKKKPWTKETSR